MKDDKDIRPLQKMFSDVPPSYDLLNRILTLGFDQLWRKKAAVECLRGDPLKVLDLCCGTGDLLVRLGRMAHSGTGLSALDYSQPMLDLARKKAARHKIGTAEFIQGDAAFMPFADNQFDSVGIAFAFRNLTFHNPDRERFMAEIIRVLRPGGRFVIVETSQPQNAFIRKFFHFYLRSFAGPVGGLLSGHYGAYRYLAHSARNYYSAEGVREILTGSGFVNTGTRALMGGIAAVITAEKPVIS